MSGGVPLIEVTDEGEGVGIGGEFEEAVGLLTRVEVEAGRFVPAGAIEEGFVLARFEKAGDATGNGVVVGG